MNKLDYAGKTVLVVGGTSGIGNGVACRFRDHGANVHIWGTRASLDEYSDDPDADFDDMRFHQVNVGDPSEVDAHKPDFDRLDVLVLSQGTIFNQDEYEIDKFTQVLNINVTSLMTCCVKFKPMLTKSGGSIVMISSMGSILAVPSAPAYCASKHAVTGLCQSLALGWAKDGLRVNAIGPGVFPSRMSKVISENPLYLNAVLEKNPMRRLGEVEEIGDAAVFLGSPMASYITGQTLIVDGGHTLQDIVNHNHMQGV